MGDRLVRPIDSGFGQSSLAEGGPKDGGKPMSRTLLCGLSGLALTALISSPDPAFAITHGCTPPTGINNIRINIVLDGRTSQTSGSFCSAIQKAEAAIANSRLSAERKDAAYATLRQLQLLVAKEGRSAAGKKVSGSVGCQGSVSTSSGGGTSATATCGFQIVFG